MNWTVIINGYTKRYFKRIPRKDSDHIRKTLRELVYNPYAGDINKMEGNENIWRRRVGAYRIFYEIHENKNIIYVFEIRRRTSSTY